MTRHAPRTFNELQTAIDGGILVEDHHTDFKREIAAGKSGNRSLAVDVAAMALDGGLIIVGAVEDKPTGTVALVPVELNGLKERIDQVARDIPRPSVTVRVHEIRVTDTTGYAVVEIPMSLSSPHMVDGKYRGRSDTTNTVLSDEDVTRFHSMRTGHGDRINTALDFEIGRDPWTSATRLAAHAYAVALPTHGSPDMLDDAVNGDRARWMSEVCNVWDALQTSDGGSFAPTFGTGCYTRANGYALSDEYLGGGRVVTSGAKERSLTDLEIWVDGSVHAYNARASDQLNSQNVVMTAVIRGFIVHTLAVARHVASVANYGGGWSVGVAVTGLQHLRPYTAGLDLGSAGSPYSEPEYRRTTSCDHIELVTHLDAVADRLYLRLHQALGLPQYPRR